MVAARQSGANMDGWLRAKLLIAVFGAMAEARLRRRSFAEVWRIPESINDEYFARRDCALAGLESEADELISAAVNKASQLIEKPEVWRAILALASMLPHNGTMNGVHAAQIIQSALGGFVLEDSVKNPMAA
jgi:hypothetical protein